MTLYNILTAADVTMTYVYKIEAYTAEEAGRFFQERKHLLYPEDTFIEEVKVEHTQPEEITIEEA